MMSVLQARGVYRSSDEDRFPVYGFIWPHSLWRIHVFNPIQFTIQLNGFMPIYTPEADYSEVSTLARDKCEFTIDYTSGSPDLHGMKYDINGKAFFYSQNFEGSGSGAVASGLIYRYIHFKIKIYEQVNGSFSQTGQLFLRAMATST